MPKNFINAPKTADCIIRVGEFIYLLSRNDFTKGLPMSCLKRIFSVALALSLSAVAAPKQGKMVDPRDGKVYGTMDAVGLTWMTEYFPDEMFPFGKAKTVCPDVWRLPTLNEGLSLLISFGVKFGINDKSLVFSIPAGRDVKVFAPLGIESFVTSDGYLVMLQGANESSKKYDGAIMAVAELDKQTRRLIGQDGPPDADSFNVYVRCVKKK